MIESKQAIYPCEVKLQSFKSRYQLHELNTSKETAIALRVSDFTLRLSRSTGQLLGKKAPKHVNYGRTVRYHAADLMLWLEQFNELEVQS